MKVCIPSRGRSESIGRHTLRLIPSAFVLVDEAERDDYARVVPEGQLLTHPGLTPLSRIMNYMLDTVADDVVVMADDDVSMLYAIPGWMPRRRSDPVVALQVLENAAQCAIDAKCGLFGFSQNENPMFFKPQDPIRLSRWVGSVIGFVGDHGLRYDERFTLMEDVDLCLQSLLRHRIIWCETRWRFVNDRLNSEGGSAHIRSDAAFEAERQLLREKWGDYVTFSRQASWGDRVKTGQEATTVMTSLHVPRRASGGE